MFLNELSPKENSAFLSLVSQFAKIDNVIDNEEEKLIEEYLKELSLEREDIKDYSYDEVMEVLKGCKTRVKSIIYFELVGLALVDGEYGDKEIDFLDMIAVSLDIRRDKKIAFANFFYAFKEVHDFSVVNIDSKKIKTLRDEADALL